MTTRKKRPTARRRRASPRAAVRAVTVRKVAHAAAVPLAAVILSNAAGIGVVHRGMYCAPAGPWIPFGEGTEPAKTRAAEHAYALPALESGSLVQAAFIAHGREKGDRFTVEFELLQEGALLDAPDRHFHQTLALGEGGVLEWVWRYRLE